MKTNRDLEFIHPSTLKLQNYLEVHKAEKEREGSTAAGKGCLLAVVRGIYFFIRRHLSLRG